MRGLEASVEAGARFSVVEEHSGAYRISVAVAALFSGSVAVVASKAMIPGADVVDVAGDDTVGKTTTSHSATATPQLPLSLIGTCWRR